MNYVNVHYSMYINIISILIKYTSINTGFIGFGFALQNGNPLYGVLLLQCIDGFGQAVNFMYSF